MATYSLKRSTGGHLLRTTGGHLANECPEAACTIYICTSSRYGYCFGGYSKDVPGVNMTVTFAGGGTKSLFGETWSSGETKIICPTTYDCSTYTTTNYVYPFGTYSNPAAREHWEAAIGYSVLEFSGFNNWSAQAVGKNGTPTYTSCIYPAYLIWNQASFGATIEFAKGSPYGYTYGSLYAHIAGVRNTAFSARFYGKGYNCFTKFYSSIYDNYGTGSYNISAFSPRPNALAKGAPIANNTGSVTTADGITISWTQQGNWNTCGI